MSEAFTFKENNKKINYFGMKLIVPKSAKWIATDRYGDVYGYEEKPELVKGSNSWQLNSANYYQVGIVRSVKFWQKSLMEIK